MALGVRVGVCKAVWFVYLGWICLTQLVVEYYDGEKVLQFGWKKKEELNIPLS